MRGIQAKSSRKSYRMSKMRGAAIPDKRQPRPDNLTTSPQPANRWPPEQPHHHGLNGSQKPTADENVQHVVTIIAPKRRTHIVTIDGMPQVPWISLIRVNLVAMALQGGGVNTTKGIISTTRHAEGKKKEKLPREGSLLLGY